MEEKRQLDIIKGFLSNMHLYNAALKDIRSKLEIIDEEYKLLNEHDPIHHIESRLKTPESILSKIQRRNFKTDQEIHNGMYDIAGIRVVCNYVCDVYFIVNLIKSWNKTVLLEKDYIKNPKKNGYRSYHLILLDRVNLSKSVEEIPVEIQIRTVTMDVWASLEHEIHYKDLPDSIKEEKLLTCSLDLARIDQEMETLFLEGQNEKNI